ncbi:MAG TPA: cytidine deaminase [Verrucomicrobia bacterium]|nr:cytidine deaminase [Verrucomicrobiota bacterium]
MSDPELIEIAIHVADHAYCPYSRFHVGAALRADDGRVFTGVNVENASFGLTICAERSAISAAISAGARRVSVLAIAADGEQATPPCGACRQVLAEFAGADLEIVLVSLSTHNITGTFTLAELLPHTFKHSPK